MDPIAILPSEIWEVIFEYLVEAQDWLNLYRSSSYFQQFFEKERVIGLFPHVYHQLLKYLGGVLNQTLRLRLVSKQWRQVVDRELEKHANPKIGVELKRKYIFKDSATITSFLDKFDTSPAGYPIIGRFVLLLYNASLHDPRILMEYTDSVSRLLHKFGKHLRGMEILDGTGYWNRNAANSLGDFVERLKNVVGQTPALDTLAIEVVSVVGFQIEGAENAGRNDEVDPLAEEHPLLIPNLRSLSFHHQAFFGGLTAENCFVEWQKMIFNICVNPESLKHLSIVCSPGPFPDFPRLESATLRILEKEDCAKLPTNCSFPLIKLVLTSPVADIYTLLRTTEHFKETLTSLVIHTPSNASPQAEELMDKVDLPHLKHLQLPRPIPLDILENLVSLEVLQILDVQDIGVFVSLVHSSGIFNKLPKLIRAELSEEPFGGQVPPTSFGRSYFMNA